MPYKPKMTLLPRSILSPLHEPLFDPKDGHGARSSHDAMILTKWKAAKAGDDGALADLLKIVVRENVAELKAAKGKEQWIRYGGGPYKIRSLIPPMTRLGMISSETVEVAPENSGHAIVTMRQKISLAPWFAEYAFEREGVKPEAVQAVVDWLADGGIQRPERWEGEY